MTKTKLCQCNHECDHPFSYALSRKELKDLYDYLKHQYVSYNNLDLIELVKQMGKEME